MNQHIFKLLLVAFSIVISTSGQAWAGNSASGTVRMGVILVIPVQAQASQSNKEIQIRMGANTLATIPVQPNTDVSTQLRELPLPESHSGNGAESKPRKTLVLVTRNFVAE